MQLHVQKHYIQFALKCILTTPIPNKLGRCVKFKKKQNAIHIFYLHFTQHPNFLDFGFYKVHLYISVISTLLYAKVYCFKGSILQHILEVQ